MGKHNSRNRIDVRKSADFETEAQSSLPDSLPIIIWTMDAQGVISYANAAWYDYTGLTASQTRALEWNDVIHQSDFPEYNMRWRDAQDRNEEFDVELRLRAANNRYRWQLARVVPLRDGSWLGSMTDLQRQKESEEALIESEQRFKVLADTAPVLMWRADPDKLRSYFNRRWLEFTGRKVEQERGNGWTHGVHPDDVQNCIDMYVQSFEQRDRYEIEYRLKRADGQYRWVLETGVPLFTPYGAFAGYIGSCIDIHDRRRAEEELRRSRNQLEAIFRGVGEGIGVQDADGRMIYANDAMARIIGENSADRIVGRLTSELASDFEILDEAGQLVPLEKLPVALAIQGFKTPEVTLQLRSRIKGIDRWIVLSSTPVFNELGQVQFAVNIFRDITYQKSSQRALQFLAEATLELNRSLDYHDTLQGLANKTVPFLADWCAVYTIDESGSVTHEAIAHTDTRYASRVLALLARYPVELGSEHGIGYVLRTGKPEFIPQLSKEVLARLVPELALRQELSGLKLNSLMMLPLSVGGKVLGCIALATAESKRTYTTSDLLLAEQLAARAALAIENARLYRQSQQALGVRDDFLSIASHELKTPVTSIKAFLQALRKRMETPESFDFRKNAQYMDLSIKQVDRLNAIVNDLLDINRMSQGRLEYTFKTVPIGPAIAEVVERMTASHPGRRIVVKLQNLRAKASLDELRFEQVLTNLITNALKYSPEEAVTDILMHVRDSKIIVEVKDRGMGIALEDQEHIFEQYYRTPEAVKSRAGGMGVGLFISNQIIMAHGGTLKVKSDLGKGSTFIIELPCVEDC